MNPFLSCLLLFILFSSGCGGGGGGGDGDDTTTPSLTGTISGTLIVPPSYSLEIEPDDAPLQAQAVSKVQKVAGGASSNDQGFLLPDAEGVTVHDLYLVEADEPVRILLTIAADDLISNDLDLILMNEEGLLLDASQGFISTELVETPGAGAFLAGVRAVSGTSAYLLSLSPAGEPESAQTQAVALEGEFMLGELLIKMRDRSPSEAVFGIASRHGLKAMEELPRGLHRMQITDPPASSAETKLELPQSRSNAVKARMTDEIKRLRRDPSVEYAEPNYIRRTQRLPNDDLFPLQWNYPLINLPQAWDQSVGSSEVIAAVLDTGILPEHPDLRNRLVPGFDFISDAARAADGDGIDPDPTDPGDEFHEFSSFHGTHVAGVVAAESDNTEGVAGVTWETRLMPLRVLGIDGGTDADIAQAIRYAAGLSNVSGTVPERPAGVINMSFGGPVFSQTVNQAVQAARNAGVVLVGAAGNGNNSDPFYPASYDGVLAVSAVDLAVQKASYSNFGPQIDLAAPGGDSQDRNGDGFPDGILSTVGDSNGSFIYRFLSGTSFAAPHVSGIVALMRGVNPALSPFDIDQMIAGTHPETGIQITRDIGAPGRDDLFGHGLIDASRAVLAALETRDGRVDIPSTLAISTGALDFHSHLTDLTFQVSNAGSGALRITDIASDQPWLTVAPAEGDAPLTVRLTVNRNGLVPGDYRATVTVASDAAQGPAAASVDVSMSVGDTAFGDMGTVFILIVDEAIQQTVAGSETDLSQNYGFSIPEIPPGSYFVVAGTDLDEDGMICEIEDPCGFYPASVVIDSGGDLQGIDFSVGELIAAQAARLTERVPLRNLIRPGLSE